MKQSPEFSMNKEPQSVPNAHIEPELLERISIYADILKKGSATQAELLLEFGMIDISTDSIINMALRSFLEGLSGADENT
jgi:hypothetical protein